MPQKLEKRIETLEKTIGAQRGERVFITNDEITFTELTPGGVRLYTRADVDAFAAGGWDILILSMGDEKNDAQ